MPAGTGAGPVLVFELNQLRSFVAVAEELHFGHAAERLNMTQPPVSRQVRLLEQSLGVALLERTSRSVKLTPAGRAFLPEARHTLGLAEGAGLAARRVARGEAGSIALGCTAAASYGLLPRLVAFAVSALPGIDLVLKELVTAEQLEALAAGRLDIGLVRPPFDRRRLGHAGILRERLLLAVPRGHRLEGRAEARVADIDGEALVMWSPVEARYFHDLVTGLCAAAGAVPRHVQFITQTHTMLALVSAGLGLAVVPEAARAMHFEGVTLQPLKAEGAVAMLHMVWRPDSSNPALATFRDAVLGEFAPARPNHLVQGAPPP